ncbi:MAG: 1-(5-phosphoribosyl)-5-[(5-phosphoribosylamino)methylideneamino]imidazole-4-carboxamide isomerase [Kiritimatiellae bacterium]|nr:1-(5-phosphoribosyl)-5-[(5-phosphoribosylamino)methylideneamino]imidazole-4-carboxamide isomerase [Kiritimatiellia bacterium]
MTIFPAIDLQHGRCVRLRQGRAEEATVYGEDPVAMARHWLAQGARALHVVDLDGAFRGEPAHAGTIADIAAAVPIPVQTGGGLRTDAHVRQMLATGVKRVILGTRALADEQAVARLVREHGGDRVAVGIDARDGWVQIKGWVETTAVQAVELARHVADAGVDTIIYTDTATDGMLVGPNLKAMSRICQAVSCHVIASGGIGGPEDIRALASLGHTNLEGAIVGKALYEGRATLAELLAAAEG